MKLLKENLYESYLDPEEKFYDYQTQDINGNDIFDISKTGMSYYDNFLNSEDLKYMETAKGVTGKIEQLTPKEYFEDAADIFGTNTERLIRNVSSDTYTIKHLEHVIIKYKRKFPLPFLNYAANSQEGMHRMHVAGELFGWDTKFPVLIVTEYKTKLEGRNRKYPILKFTAEESNCIKSVTEYGGSYKYLNRKFKWNEPAELVVRDFYNLDLLSYAVEEQKDEIEKSIKRKVDQAYKDLVK